MSTPPINASDLQSLATHYGLSEATLESLARVVIKSDRELTMQPTAELCHQNDPADALYILVEGSLRILRNNRVNVLEEFAEAHAPAVLGRLGLVLQNRRSASLVAGPHGDRVLALPKEQVEWLIQGNSPESDALRRLMLAAQLNQHHRAVVDILRALKIEAPMPTGWTGSDTAPGAD